MRAMIVVLMMMLGGCGDTIASECPRDAGPDGVWEMPARDWLVGQCAPRELICIEQEDIVDDPGTECTYCQCWAGAIAIWECRRRNGTLSERCGKYVVRWRYYWWVQDNAPCPKK